MAESSDEVQAFSFDVEATVTLRSNYVVLALDRASAKLAADEFADNDRGLTDFAYEDPFITVDLLKHGSLADTYPAYDVVFATEEVISLLREAGAEESYLDALHTGACGLQFTNGLLDHVLEVLSTPPVIGSSRYRRLLEKAGQQPMRFQEGGG